MTACEMRSSDWRSDVCSSGLAQRLERGKPLLHLSQLSPRDLVGLGTWPALVIGQIQQLADCVERKAQLERMPDEGQPVELSIAIAALTALAPAWFRQDRKRTRLNSRH